MTDIVALNKIASQKAKNYCAGVAWPTVLLCLVTFASYWSLPYLVMLAGLTLWLAIPGMIALTYAAYTVLHESVHGSINGSNTSMKWVNDGLGYLAGTILAIPLTAHRIEHLTHHAMTNYEGKDPDSYSANIMSSPLGMLQSAWKAIAIQYQLYSRLHWPKASRTVKATFVLEVVFIIMLRILPFFVLWQSGDPEVIAGWWRVLALFLVAGLLGTIALVYLFAYIVHRPHNVTGRFIDTATIVIPKPFSTLATVLWGYQNYHSIHHLFPRVPFYHYRRLFHDIADTMDAMNAPVYRLTLRGLKSIKAMDA
tara:strand:- start:419 stop:1348 length:930 start_codon:yes stop_codon:yes gene_type:complete